MKWAWHIARMENKTTVYKRRIPLDRLKIRQEDNIKIDIVCLSYEPGYITLCVGNRTEEKVLCKCVWISHRHMSTGGASWKGSSKFLIMT
jgi:hypothetical protein